MHRQSGFLASQHVQHLKYQSSPKDVPSTLIFNGILNNTVTNYKLPADLQKQEELLTCPIQKHSMDCILQRNTGAMLHCLDESYNGTSPSGAIFFWPPNQSGRDELASRETGGSVNVFPCKAKHSETEVVTRNLPCKISEEHNLAAMPALFAQQGLHHNLHVGGHEKHTTLRRFICVHVRDIAKRHPIGRGNQREPFKFSLAFVTLCTLMLDLLHPLCTDGVRWETRGSRGSLLLLL